MPAWFASTSRSCPRKRPANIIKVKDIIRFLREHGLKGKERSMYSYTYDILKKEAKTGNLEFGKGRGLLEACKDQHDDELGGWSNER
jgi:hypothetical protein